MFLKRRKIIQFIICILAAVTICVGLHFREAYYFINSDVATEADYATIEFTTEVELTGQQVTTQEFGATQSTQVSGEDGQSTTLDPVYDESPGEEDRASSNNNLKVFSIVLVVAGIFLGIVYVLGFDKKKSGCIEAAVVSVYINLILANAVYNYSINLMYNPLGIFSFIFFVRVLFTVGILASFKTIVNWFFNRCSLSWSLPDILGKNIVNKTGKYKYYIYILLGCFLLSVLATVYFCTSSGIKTIEFSQKATYHFIVFTKKIHVGAVAVSVFIFIIDVALIVKYANDIEHLNMQIANLYNETKPVICSNAFGYSEKLLCELNAKHRDAVQQATKSERFKVELISNVSHDLRTPLTSILGYGELLQNETLSEEGTRQLASLNKKAGYMRELVETLFELTKASSGSVNIKNEEIDIIRLLEQTIGLYDNQLKEANLSVKTHFLHERLIYYSDGTLLHQIIANLLGNAIKYTPRGSRIHLEEKETETSYIIRMTNISSYEMDFTPEEIVQRFARGDKARTTKGSGLGLAIAQTYSSVLGGDFHVEIDGEQFSAIVELPKKENPEIERYS